MNELYKGTGAQRITSGSRQSKTCSSWLWRRRPSHETSLQTRQAWPSNRRTTLDRTSSFQWFLDDSFVAYGDWEDQPPQIATLLRTTTTTQQQRCVSFWLWPRALLTFRFCSMDLAIHLTEAGCRILDWSWVPVQSLHESIIWHQQI